MMVDDVFAAANASRLSGECHKSANYIRNREVRRAFSPEPWRNVPPAPPRRPRRSLPRNPGWRPSPRPKTPAPYKPGPRPKRPFGRPPSLPGPPVRMPPGAIGRGLAKWVLKRAPWFWIAMWAWDLARWSSAFQDWSGWTKKCDVGYGPGDGPVFMRSTLNDPNVACSRVALDVPGGFVGGYSIPAGHRWASVGEDNSIGPNPRMGRNEQYTRPAGKPAVRFNPGLFPPPYVVPWPALDPFPLPIEAPAPDPLPLPRRFIPDRKPRRNRSPDEQPDSGRGPKAEPLPPPAIPPVPVAPPRNSVPGRKRERKLVLTIRNIRMLGHFLEAAVGWLTEGIDLVEVAFNSLSKDVQKGNWYLPPHEKLWLVINNLDKLDPYSFLVGFIAESLEDRHFANMSKRNAEILKQLYEETGHSFQPELGQGLDTGYYLKDVSGWEADIVDDFAAFLDGL